MDSFQSPSPNDQRRFSTTALTIGVDPAKLDACSPDAASQPTPVNRIGPVPSAKTLVLMRQLEALAHEVAFVSRGDSSNQSLKVHEGSNFSAGLQVVEPSIRGSSRDQLARDGLLFGRRTSFSLAGFIRSVRDRLRSYRPSFGKQSATLANLFIAARDWLVSYRPSFDGPSAAVAGFFREARSWLAGLTRSFGRRRSPALASFFIAALIGVAVAFVWQSQRASTAKSPNDLAVAEKQSGFTPIGQLSVQDRPPQIAPATRIAPASTTPATSSESVQQLEDIARDLVVLRRRVEELATKQEHLGDAQEQLAARQEQMAHSIAKLQPVTRNINNKMSSPPRRNGLPEPAAQASLLPRPRPSVPADHR
jgi:hypothetical protein